jgi:predicted nucleic acid-binding protein
VTTHLVIAEVHRLTLFRVGVQAALRGLDRIDASSSVRVHFAGAAEHRAARQWLERLAPRSITYTDAVSFAVMEATRCRQVLGFDQDFVAAGYSLWPGRS